MNPECGIIKESRFACISECKGFRVPRFARISWLNIPKTSNIIMFFHNKINEAARFASITECKMFKL